MLRTPDHWDIHAGPAPDQTDDQIADYRPEAGRHLTDDQYDRWLNGK